MQKVIETESLKAWRAKTEFRHLLIGDTFDFISPHQTQNSFFDRCEKISQRKYRSLDREQEYTVGSITANVYHVK